MFSAHHMALKEYKYATRANKYFTGLIGNLMCAYLLASLISRLSSVCAISEKGHVMCQNV